ncbi:hypothetical protein AYK24_06885 [Thermoplasmatales archaeon SG8-52-4]|nr:MAG: hypothetical protein AYK24_06885 [Thermoplasmatales archaeon SG8-52-4]
MNKILFRKGVIIGIILLFIGASITPLTLGIKKINITKKTISTRGIIQGLIDNASDGDTIYIPSGIYYENISINKSISLIGEDKNTTIIDGGENGTVVYVLVYWVNISGFTIRNSGYGQWPEESVGLCYVGSPYCSIKDCIIENNFYGILFIGYGGCNYNLIQNNIIKDNGIGICFAHAYHSFNLVCNNIIYTNDIGIIIQSCNYNEIFSNNILSNTEKGIILGSCICGGYNNKVYHNNLIFNGDENGQAQNEDFDNFWDDGYPSGGNFWSDYTGVDNFSGPNQTIPGSDGIGDVPYEIPSSYIDEEDTYPLMEVLYGDFPPIADFNWTPYLPGPEDEIFFNASESYDYDGSITQYEWDWDNDGVFDESNTIPTTTHTFLEAGYYQIILRVQNNNFEYDTKTATIHVNTPPEALTITGITSGKPNITYDFTFNAIDPDGDNVRYIIDWGDNNIDTTGFNPSGADVIVSHSWSETGSYEGSVYAEDEYEAKGNETIFTITIKKSKSIQNPILNWLQSHPNLFPIIKQILNLIITQ